MEYRIGSFNVKNLNYAEEKFDERKVKRSFETIAKIIKDEEFAVIALQEVLSDGAIERIKRYLGKNWKSAWEKPVPKEAGDKADKRGEGYAYIWDSKKVDLVSIEVDNVLREFIPRIWHQYQKRGTPLVREPYYARFTPVSKIGGCFCEIRLINTHIVFGDNSSKGILLRLSEFNKIVNSVYQNIANKRYGNNMPAYVVILGDYNLSIANLEGISSETTIQVGNSSNKRKEEHVTTQQGEKTTVNHIKQEDGTYKSEYVSNYDHFSFIQKYEEIMDIVIERIDTQKYCKDLVEYWETVSDHIPVKMTINLNRRSTKKLLWNE